jgi:hypothetical protein
VVHRAHERAQPFSVALIQRFAVSSCVAIREEVWHGGVEFRRRRALHGKREFVGIGGRVRPIGDNTGHHALMHRLTELIVKFATVGARELTPIRVVFQPRFQLLYKL